MIPDADVVVVFGGTNDFGHGDAPIGTMADRTNDSFYGAYHLLMQQLISHTVHLFDWGKSRWYEGFIAIDFTYERFPEPWLLEICSVVEQIYSYEQFYAYTGDSKWAERLEPHFGCCTSNFNQGWPKLTLSAFLHQGNTVISSIPVPSELKTDDQHILLETNDPFDNTFTYTIESAADFTFCIRIPSFAKNLTVNGEAAPRGDLTFAIRAGEHRQINLSYDAQPHFEERPYGLQIVKWGSLVFSVPIRYEKRMHEYEKDGVERKFPYCDYEYVPTSDWNYAFCDQELALEKGTVGDIPFSGSQPPVVIKASMQMIDWGLEDGYEAVCAKIPQSVTPIAAPEEVTLYPYGCAKLRITEAPAAK